MPDTDTRVDVTEHIDADPVRLYEMVSDVTKMGQWSPETTACKWKDGSTGPAVGARFSGSNKSGWRRWSTTCTVTAAEPGKRFAFDVTVGPIKIARWTYSFEPSGNGTSVTERWDDMRPKMMIKPGGVMMGVMDRAAHNRAGMQKTLANLKAAAER